MRTEKQLKEYADGKMEELKNEEFFNSVNDTHFQKQKKRSPLWKKAVSAFVSCAVITVAVALLSWGLQNSAGYNSAQYKYSTATLSDVNDECAYFRFSENFDYTITAVSERNSVEKLYYEINLSLNNGKDSIAFVVIVNAAYDYAFGDYELHRPIGSFSVKYKVTPVYGDNGVVSHIIDAHILTDSERIAVQCVSDPVENEDSFFELLSDILIIK